MQILVWLCGIIKLGKTLFFTHRIRLCNGVNQPFPENSMVLYVFQFKVI